MKRLSFTIVLIFTVLCSACSFGYEVLIVNASNSQIEIRYKVAEKGHFDDPETKSIEGWNARKSIARFWKTEEPWQNCPETQYETNLDERTIKLSPGQVIKIEHGGYNPIREERGDLTDIIELKIITSNGNISYAGRLLLSQFQKDGYTFIKTIEDEPKNHD